MNAKVNTNAPCCAAPRARSSYSFIQTSPHRTNFNHAFTQIDSKNHSKRSLNYITHATAEPITKITTNSTSTSSLPTLTPLDGTTSFNLSHPIHLSQHNYHHHIATTTSLLTASYESTCAFSSYANWIIPGTVLLGRYPYVEPSRCLIRDQGIQQLEEIIDAGINTFICLQGEIPPQDDMTLAGVNGFLPYKAQATLVAAARSEPPRLEEISALRTPELDKFLPPRRKPQSFPERKRIELDFVHCPIVDLGLPSEEQLCSLIDTMQLKIARGEKLYVHCWGGRGRAGTVGAALLMTMYGMNADEALARVQRAFDTRQDNQRRSPETDEQHDFVRRYGNAL